MAGEARLHTILLINPNTSVRSLAMMLTAAAGCLPDGIALRGVHADAGAAMIVDEAGLAASEPEVLRLGLAGAAGAAAIVVAAFGDPGLARLRAAVRVPVIGIGEASILDAAAAGRRFGIATTTLALVPAIRRRVEQLGLAGQFTGVRVPDGDPLALAADPPRQTEALAWAAADCFDTDKADAVIIGGGPLSDAARLLRDRFGDRIVDPVPAAMRRAAVLLGFSGIARPGIDDQVDR